MIVLRFTPTFTNLPKDIPCEDLAEAEKLKEWFEYEVGYHLGLKIVLIYNSELIRENDKWAE